MLIRSNLHNKYNITIGIMIGCLKRYSFYWRKFSFRVSLLFTSSCVIHFLPEIFSIGRVPSKFDRTKKNVSAVNEATLDCVYC